MAETAVGAAPDGGTPNHGNSTLPQGKISEIEAAWGKAVEQHGPVTYDDPSTIEAEAVADEADAVAAETIEKKPKPKAEKKTEPAEEPAAAAAEEPAEEVVTVGNLIKERQAARERYNRREQALEQEYARRHQSLEVHIKRLGPLAEAGEAIDSGDADAFAAAVCKYRGIEAKNWNDLNSEILQNLQSPVFKEMRTLRQRQEQDRQERAARENAEAQRQGSLAQAQAERDWKAQMVDTLATDADGAVAKLADVRPEMADLMLRIQKAHHQESRGEVLASRIAAERALASVVEDFQRWSAFIEENADSPLLKKLMGNRSAPKTADTRGTREAATPEKRVSAKAPPKTVSHTRGASVSAQAPMTSEQLKAFYARKMQSEMDRNPSGHWGHDDGS